MEMPFKLSNLISNLALTPGYLNPALNNSALNYYFHAKYIVTQIKSLLFLILKLWQNKRLDAQSKNKKLWLGGKP